MAARKFTTILICTGCNKDITITGDHAGHGKVSCLHCDLVSHYTLIYPLYHQSQIVN